MARPQKNNVDYFPHDRDMRDHKKVKAIRLKFGIAGYAIWSMLLEYLAGNDGNVFEYSDIEFELMAGDFGVSATEIRDVVDYCIRLEMLFVKNGFVNSDSLDERLLPVYQKRGKSKELSKQQQRMNGKFVGNNTDSTAVSVTEIPQSKVKESKENKTNNIDSRKLKFASTLNAFVETYGKEMIRDFYEYWTEPNKSNTKFKQELQQTWSLERRLKKWAENDKSKPKPQTTVYTPNTNYHQ